MEIRLSSSFVGARGRLRREGKGKEKEGSAEDSMG